MSGFTIDEAAIPVTLDAEDAADFVAMVETRNAVEAHAYGGNDLAVSPAELLPRWQDEFEPRRLLLAHADGRVVARGIVEIAREEGSDVAWLTAEVLPEYRGRGIGSALAERLQLLALSDGRTTWQTFAIARAVPGDRLDAPTGFGSVPLEDDGVKFLTHRGWALEQVERISKLALPVAPDLVARQLADAVAASGPDYRVHTWIGAAPERWREDLAVLFTRMSTDAPSGGLDSPEDVWTVERILAYEDRESGSGRDELFAAVEHVPSGRLVGHTYLAVPGELERAVSQEDTIVIREHRGHRLGMLLKLANIQHLEERAPGHPSITTFNAEENRHMLSVNEAVGFVPVGYEGGWKKVSNG